jgi:HlyD family secretion protein
MSGRGKRILWIGIGAIVLLLVVISNLKRSAGGQVAVQAGDVKKGTISATVRAPGRVQPETQVKLSANVPGQVVRLSVKEGDRVRKGQFLLQIDDTQYRAQLREATAALAAARSNLRLTESALEQSEASWKRKESLFAQKLVSPEELDQARTQRNSDKARADSNREEVERGEAAVQVSEDNLRKTRFDAPIDGTVTQLSIERGEIAVIGTMNNPGTVILTVADLATMKVEADVDETDVSAVTLGQTAEVRVDALPDTTLTGRVSEIANSPSIQDMETQEQQTNFKVDVMIDNPPKALRPGMTADVEIKTATRDSVLYVPIQAVVVRSPEELKPVVKGKRTSSPRAAKAQESNPTPPPGDSKLKKVEEIRGVFIIVGGQAEFRRVKPGISSDTDFEVAGELKPGEKVVIGPHKTLRTLKPGQKVKIEEPKKPKAKEQS